MPDPIRLDDHRDESTPPPEEEMAEQGLLGMNPWVLWGLLAVSIAVCGPIVFAYAPETWGLPRKLLATGFIGAWGHYCLFINRILVANW